MDWADKIKAITKETQGTYKQMTPDERAHADVLGPLSVQVYKNGPHSSSLPSFTFEEAYNALLNEASVKFAGNIDIRNVTVKLGYYNGGTNKADFTVDGIVISLKDATAKTAAASGVEGALARVAETLIAELPKNSIIAVLSVASPDHDMTTLIVDELEDQLVTSRQFKIADRKSLDAIRSEQNFQMSGDVDDNSAVDIGKMLGATVVITGSMSGSGTSQRLTIKALDVMTAQIITMAREQF
jgi:TolB-like protein